MKHFRSTLLGLAVGIAMSGTSSVALAEAPEIYPGRIRQGEILVFPALCRLSWCTAHRCYRKKSVA